MSQVIFFYIAFIALLIPKGLTLRCYFCATNNVISTTTCKTGALTEFNVVPCLNGENYCSTVTTYLTALGISSVNTVRKCRKSAYNTGCVTVRTTKTCASSCKTDRCNSGTGSVRIGGGNTFMLVSMLVAMASSFL